MLGQTDLVELFTIHHTAWIVFVDRAEDQPFKVDPPAVAFDNILDNLIDGPNLSGSVLVHLHDVQFCVLFLFLSVRFVILMGFFI